MAPPLAIAILGPTAAGKTELALELAERLPCELISVDSTQVYRGMDIGSAKPSPQVLARLPHRLIDICDPAEAYSAARFRADALVALAEIHTAGRIPLLVGGTMLYLRALVRGLSPLPEANPEIRARLGAEVLARGLPALYQRLAAVDGASARRIHPHDPQRILRALEVYELTGVPMSELQTRGTGEAFPCRLVKLARAPRERGLLHARIAARFHAMLVAGLEDEVRALLARPDLHPGLPALRAVGYRQVVGYLRGEYPREEMIERGIAATRQLARRQLTWLRADPQVDWLYDEAGPVLPQALERLAEIAL
jgi:tRNA dimethylallyltransferase